ncbi:MAG: hypothetical protein R2795_21030 [Saprospiraceae bacterium]
MITPAHRHEMQILDNTCHPTMPLKNTAQVIYDHSLLHLQFCSAGEWNRVRIVLKDGHLGTVAKWQKVVATPVYTCLE